MLSFLNPAIFKAFSIILPDRKIVFKLSIREAFTSSAVALPLPEPSAYKVKYSPL